MTPAKKESAARPKRAAKPSTDETADIFLALAGKSKRARLMSEVEEFRSVRTIFSGFNRQSTVGGAPLSNVALLHGPSQGGKTAFSCGLIRSFQEAGAPTMFVDAELAAETKKWFRRMGVDGKKCLYVGRTDADAEKSPLTYEEIVEEVDGTIERYRAGKRAGSIPPKTPFLIVVDSLSKMVPKSMLKDLDSAKGGDVVRSGVGRLQAAMNTAWFLALGPKVGDDDILFVAIVHEMEEQGGDKWGPDFKVRGGKGIVYDSMLQIRVTFAGQVKDLAADDAAVTGKRHKISLLKNKHGPSFEKNACYFYTSNGKGAVPVGFDRGREVVHEALIRGVIKGPSLDGLKLTLGTRLEVNGEKHTLGDFLRGDRAAGLVVALEQELDRLLYEEALDES